MRTRHAARTVLTGIAAATAVVVATAPTSARPGDGPQNGRIAFYRHSRSTEAHHVFSVDPDGTDTQRLTTATAAHPHWSPDGTEIAVDAEIDTPTQPSAVVYDVDTGRVRRLTGTLGRVCYTWSPDGSRLACSGDNPDDPGITTIRSSDGGDLQRVTDFVSMVGDYSPDGKWVSLVGDHGDGLREFVVRLDGTDLQPLSPPGMLGLNDEQGGSWSPDGNQVLFHARVDVDHRNSLWSVRPDGTGLHQVPVPDCGGLRSDPYSIGCLEPSWSPDGRQIAFRRFDSHTGAEDIYTVHADGTRLTRVTSTGTTDQFPDWGTHPVE